MQSKQIDSWHVFAAILSILAVLLAYCIATFALQHVTLNADENSYLFQAHNFLEGIVAKPFPPFPDAFHHEMIIISSDVGWLSRYAPGHPLFLVPGVFLGNPYLWVALAAGLSVFLVYLAGRRLDGYVTGISAAILLLFSPYFLLYAGTLVSHTSGILATTAMLCSYIYWRKTGDTRFAVMAGLAWAFFFINRSYTAVLIALPFAVDSLWHLYQERSKKMLIATCSFAVASFSGVLVLLVYNWLSTGDLWMMTYLKYSETQRLGFGVRHFGRIEHSLGRGVEILVSNLASLNTWLWGFPGSLILCFGLFFWGWKKSWSWLFIAAVLSIWAGYIFFWHKGALDFGPIYYLEILPFLVLGAALGIKRVLDYIKFRYVLIVLTAWLAINLPFTIAAGMETREKTTPRRLIMDALQELPEGSLVFIDPQEHQAAFKDGNDMIFNPQGLDSSILSVRSFGEQDKVLVRFFRERTPFRLLGGDKPVLIPIDSADDYDLLIHPHSLHRRTGTNIHSPSGEFLRIAREADHPAGMLASGRRFYVAPGRYIVDFFLEADGCAAHGEVAMVDVAVLGGRIILASGPVFSDVDGDKKTLQLDIDEFLEIEPRIYYLGCGNISLRQIRISENQLKERI